MPVVESRCWSDDPNNNLVKSVDEIYFAAPVNVDEIENQFDQIYNDATKHDKDVTNGYKLNNNTERTLGHFGSEDEDVFDHSGSVSSYDESLLIYNVGTGKIINKRAEPNYLKEEGFDESIQLPSVRNLAKKFNVTPTTEKPKLIRRRTQEVAMSDMPALPSKQPIHMHSLTARSISREFREGLKSSMPIITNPHPGGSKTIPDGTNEPVNSQTAETEAEEIPPPGSVKNKLSFFEQLTKD